MFYQGLKPTLKDISGYKFEQIKDFDKLSVEIRTLEHEHLVTPSSGKVKITHCNLLLEQMSEMSEIKLMLHFLTDTVKELEK